MALWNGSRRDCDSSRLGERRGIPVDRWWRERGSLDVPDLYLRWSISRVGTVTKYIDGIGEIVICLALGSQGQSP